MMARDDAEMGQLNLIEEDGDCGLAFASGRSLTAPLPEVIAQAMTDHNDDSLRFDSFHQDYF